MRQQTSQAIHPITFKLPHGARSVYTTLCALIAPGATRRLSQAQIAAIGVMSEATVSRAMPVLEEFGLVERTPAAGGHDISLITLPEPPSADELLAQLAGSVADPFYEALGSATDPALECAPDEGSATDPSVCMDDHDQVLMQEEEEGALACSSGYESDPRYQQLLNLGADETIADDIFLNMPPGWTTAELIAQIAYCKSRPDRFGTPAGYVFGAWRHGRKVTIPRARSGPPPAKRNAPAAEHCYDAPPATNAEADAAARRAYVLTVAPDADDDTIGFVLDCHDRGLSVDEARVELEAAYVGT